VITDQVNGEKTTTA